MWMLPFLGDRWAEIGVIAGSKAGNMEAQFGVAMQTFRSLGVRQFFAFYYPGTGATMPLGVQQVPA